MAKAKKSKNISLAQNEAVLLYQKIFNQHHSEVTSLYKDGIRTSLGLIKLIFEQKDEAFEKTLSIVNEISENADLIKLEDYTEKLKVVNDEITLLSESEGKLRDELLIMNHELNKLRHQFEAEDAAYNKIIELKNDLDRKKYIVQRAKSLILSLELADKINKIEIDLIEKSRDKIRLEKKLRVVNYFRENLEHGKYRELYAIKNSLDAVKIIARHNLEKAQRPNNRF